MRVGLFSRGKLTDISVRLDPHDTQVTQYLLGLDEHDLRDLEFELARNRAMSRRCTEVHGRHTCSLAPGHAGYPREHVCRGCTETWPIEPEEART